MNVANWYVSMVMASCACVLGVHDPLAYMWIITTARYVYGIDRYLDGKTVSQDTPTNIISAFVVSVAVLYSKSMLQWTIPEVLSIGLYPSFKRQFPLMKPVYVGSCWVFAISVVPQLMMNEPIDIHNCIGMGMLATAVSNHADIDDIEEDRQQSIHTIPVRYGRRNAIALSTSLLVASGCTFIHKKRTPRNKKPMVSSTFVPYYSYCGVKLIS